MIDLPKSRTPTANDGVPESFADFAVSDAKQLREIAAVVRQQGPISIAETFGPILDRFANRFDRHADNIKFIEELYRRANQRECAAARELPRWAWVSIGCLTYGFFAVGMRDFGAKDYFGRTLLIFCGVAATGFVATIVTGVLMMIVKEARKARTKEIDP